MSNIYYIKIRNGNITICEKISIDNINIQDKIELNFYGFMHLNLVMADTLTEYIKIQEYEYYVNLKNDIINNVNNEKINTYNQLKQMVISYLRDEKLNILL
jgi:hypothetical protein